jgi:hypothetical protein
MASLVALDEALDDGGRVPLARGNDGRTGGRR